MGGYGRVFKGALIATVLLAGLSASAQGQPSEAALAADADSETELQAPEASPQPLEAPGVAGSEDSRPLASGGPPLTSLTRDVPARRGGSSAWDPEAPIDRGSRVPSHARFFADFDFYPGGPVTLTFDEAIIDKAEMDYGLSFGVSGGAELKLGRFFGLGVGARYFSTTYRDQPSDLGRTHNFDLVALPTVHVPFRALEILIPIQVGYAMMVPPDGFLSRGQGAVFGVRPGVIFWPSRFFGVQLGIAADLYVLGGTAGEAGGVESTDWISVGQLYRLTVGASFGL